MKDDDSRASSNTGTVIILAAVLLLGVPCLGIVGLFALRVFWVSGRAVPAPAAPPPVVRPEVKVEPAPAAAPAEKGKE